MRMKTSSTAGWAIDRRREPTASHRRFPGALNQLGVRTMRGALLWLIGIPLPIIILLYLFDVL